MERSRRRCPLAQECRLFTTEFLVFGRFPGQLQPVLYPNGYKRTMNTIIRTSVFDSWLKKLKDPRGKARVIERIRSAERTHFGDYAAVGEGVFEMRVHFGPGYWVYFTRRNHAVYVLLCGGRKRSQQRDIQRALKMARLLKEE